MRIRLKEDDRDLLRATNEVLLAAQQTLDRAETAWKTALSRVLASNSIDQDQMQTMVLKDDFKHLEYEPK